MCSSACVAAWLEWSSLHTHIKTPEIILKIIKDYAYGLLYVGHTYMRWRFWALPWTYHCKLFATSELDHYSSACSYCRLLTCKCNQSSTTDLLFSNPHVMINCSQPPPSFHTSLSLHAGLWTKKQLYVTFPHPLYEDIQRPLLFK